MMLEPSDAADRKTVSIVVPCFNEEDALPFLVDRLSSVADELQRHYRVEIVLVDDGSADKTWPLICDYARIDRRVRGVSLSRNFGHQAALTCAYDLATGDAVVCMDADLQDPPEVVLEMFAKWEDGADVVYAVRRSRSGESGFKLKTASLFYRLIRGMGATYVRENSGDFRLMSRRALDALNKLREQHRFIRGMVGWVGFRTAEVHYDRKARVAGVTKYPLRKMLRFAIDATVSFSSFPLRLAYVLSSALSLIFCAYLVYTVFMHLFFDRTLVPGWSSLIISVIAFGAINLVCLGIIGEYIGRIFEQVKSRPLYLVGEDTRDDG
jgi:polyisoprenyl-phosphate glycosyltransferase